MVAVSCACLAVELTMAASDASSDYHMTGSAQPGAATQSGAARQ